MKFRVNKKHNKIDIDPDEIFLDSKNLPNFNTQQFEGRLEKPIPKRSIFILGLVFIITASVFTLKLTNLQILKGESYYQKSKYNT